jgi:competence protein ComEA
LILNLGLYKPQLKLIFFNLMQSGNFQNDFPEILKRYYFPILLGIGGIVLLLYGLIQSVNTTNKDDIVFQSALERVATQSAELIIVDVAGAVEKPGVYELAENSRIQDALIAAGGLSKDADRDIVGKSLNLATKIIDGGKIYIPFEGEISANSSSSTSSNTGFFGDQNILGASQVGLININTATSAELDTLPGVGPVTAGKIIANRPYEKIEDLVSKKAVGTAAFEKIRDKIQAY